MPTVWSVICFSSGAIPVSLRKDLTGLKVDGNCNVFKLTAYADDITIIVKDQRDIEIVNDSISLYENASSAN